MNNDSREYSKKLTRFDLYELGIPESNFDIVDTLEILRKSPPNIVVGECLKSVKFVQNNFREQELLKGYKYVMGLGIYNQLYFDTRFNLKVLKPSLKFKNIYKSYNGQNLDDKTLLIFRTGGIGDLLFIQPNLVYLKEKYPTCTIKFACGPQYHSMVEEWPCVDEVLELPFDCRELLLKSDYHCSFEGVIERCKEAETVCSYNLFTRWMGLNLPDELLIPKQYPSNERIENSKNILKEFGFEEKDFILVQMRSSSVIRTPRPSVWKKIINILTEKGYNVVLTDSPHMSPDIDNFIQTLDNKDKVKNYSHYSSTIGDTIAITSLSKGVLAIDSALIHIAESLDIKSFGIFGPFPGKVRLTTYKNSDWIDAECPCAPCFKHGNRLCENSFMKYVSCYDSLNYDLLIEKFERLMNK